MLVKIYSTLNDCVDFETDLKDTREIFNSIKHTLGEDVTDNILYSQHVFIGTLAERADVLTATSLFSDINLYEQLHIIPVVEGEEPISASAIIAAAASAASAAGASAATALSIGAALSTTIVGSVTVASVIAGVANIAIGIGISMAVSAIMTPDSSFGSDPSKAQKQSKMFNTALTINEQGGSVPLTYGNPFCGGVLISSGITSSDVGVSIV